MIGKLVFESPVINSSSFQFDGTSYDTGLYFIQVQDSNNQSHVMKLIIQH